MRRLRVLFVVVIVLGLLVLVGISPRSALAADQVVDGISYSCDRDGLAAAISASAGGTVTFSCADNVIEFDKEIGIGQDVTIDGSNGTGANIVLDGNKSSSFFVVNGGNLTIERLTMQNGRGPGTTGAQGGAIYNYDRLTIRQSTFYNNYADFTGGAIASVGVLKISQSSFIKNESSTGGALALNGGSAQITSTTFSGNISGSGSAVYQGNADPVQISWSTIFQPWNTTAALYLARGLTLTGVILGGAGSNHCSYGTSVWPTVFYSFSNDDSCDPDQTASWENQNLLLGPISTATVDGVVQSFYPLQISSPAINGGPETCDTTVDADSDSDLDQLGAPRPMDNYCDIGAIEYVNLPPIVDAGEPYTGNEGVAVALSGSASDPNNDELTYLWTYAPGAGTDIGTSCTFADATQAETTITCNDDGPFTLTLTVNDPSGEKVVDQADLTLANVAPVISDFYASPNPAMTGQLVNLSLVVDDVENDRADMYARIYFECGGGVQVSDGQCRYAQGGSYEVSVQVRDADGGVSHQSFTLEVFDEATLCANSWSGQLRMVDEGDACGRSENLIHLPEDGPASLCVNRWNGAIRASNDCGRSEHLVQVNGQDTLAVCVNTWNGLVRASERCGRSEWVDWL